MAPASTTGHGACQRTRSHRSLFAWIFAGMFFGNAVGCLLAVFATLCLKNIDTPLVTGMVQMCPTWFLVPFVFFGCAA